MGDININRTTARAQGCHSTTKLIMQPNWELIMQPNWGRSQLTPTLGLHLYTTSYCEVHPRRNIPRGWISFSLTYINKFDEFKGHPKGQIKRPTNQRRRTVQCIPTQGGMARPPLYALTHRGPEAFTYGRRPPSSSPVWAPPRMRDTINAT